MIDFNAFISQAAVVYSLMLIAFAVVWFVFFKDSSKNRKKN